MDVRIQEDLSVEKGKEITLMRRDAEGSQRAVRRGKERWYTLGREEKERRESVAKLCGENPGCQPAAKRSHTGR
jgi:hypothetical protein